MSISRQRLYAAGEPLGDSVTRKVAGRIIYGGGGGSSSSSAATNTNTQDKRLVVDGGWGVSADSSTVGLSQTNYSTYAPVVTDSRSSSSVYSPTVTDSRSSSTVDSRSTTYTDNSTTTTLDAGAIQGALDFAKKSDAIAGEGYDRLLDATEKLNSAGSGAFSQVVSMAEKLFSDANGILSKTADATLQQVGALSAAQADAKGTIDQKTMIVLGIAGAVALVEILGR